MREQIPIGSKLRRDAVQWASENGAVLHDGARIRRILEAHDVVFAIWPDGTAQCGVGLFVLKGRTHLRAAMAEEGVEQEATYSAIACHSEREANRVFLAFVEPDRAN